jgi:hypothetical protein
MILLRHVVLTSHVLLQLITRKDQVVTLLQLDAGLESSQSSINGRTLTGHYINSNMQLL